MDKDTLNQIEELLSYQQKEIHDLNDVIVRQWAEIDGLKKQLKHVKDKISGIEESRQMGNEEDGLSVTQIAERNKPPHY